VASAMDAAGPWPALASLFEAVDTYPSLIDTNWRGFDCVKRGWAAQTPPPERCCMRRGSASYGPVLGAAPSAVGLPSSWPAAHHPTTPTQPNPPRDPLEQLADGLGPFAHVRKDRTVFEGTAPGDDRRAVVIKTFELGALAEDDGLLASEMRGFQLGSMALRLWHNVTILFCSVLGCERGWGLQRTTGCCPEQSPVWGGGGVHAAPLRILLPLPPPPVAGSCC
jgi:hypothetical protein